MHTWSCSKYLTYATELFSWVNIATRHSMSYPFCRCWSVSYPSLFSRTCLVTLYYWYQMHSNSIWIGRLKIRNIRRTRNSIFAGPRESGARNKFAQKVIRTEQLRSKRLASHSVRPFLFRCNPLYRNINSTTILVHRTTVHMWRWFHGLVLLILTRSTIFAGTRERQTISQNTLFIEEALTFSQATRIKSVCPFSASGPQKHTFYQRFSPQNNGAHVKVIPRLDVLD